MDTTVRLATGRGMPAVGFGTWELAPGPPAQRAVTAAIRSGYRLVDTARIYGNEADVGVAVRSSGVDRDKLCIATKVWNDDQGYESTLAACEASLRRLDMAYVDLYLIHWPATSRRGESWRALVELQRQGKTRDIGVCNYTVRHLEELLAGSAVRPAVNQVEFHPFIYAQQRELLAFCLDNGILVQAYSPLSRIAREMPTPIAQVARRSGRSPEQVVLRWCLQHGTVPLPRSGNPMHIAANLDIFDFSLDGAAMDALDHLSDGGRVTWDPAEMR